jgi:hypothetical protein
MQCKFKWNQEKHGGYEIQTLCWTPEGTKKVESKFQAFMVDFEPFKVEEVS